MSNDGFGLRQLVDDALVPEHCLAVGSSIPFAGSINDRMPDAPPEGMPAG